MTKYKIFIEVESFLTPAQLRFSDFQKALALDLSSLFNNGIDDQNNYEGSNQNLVRLEDGSLRFFKTWYSMTKRETTEAEEVVNLKELGLPEEYAGLTDEEE